MITALLVTITVGAWGADEPFTLFLFVDSMSLLTIDSFCWLTTELDMAMLD